jgi:hypothetical protein
LGTPGTIRGTPAVHTAVKPHRCTTRTFTASFFFISNILGAGDPAHEDEKCNHLQNSIVVAIVDLLHLAVGLRVKVYRRFLKMSSVQVYSSLGCKYCRIAKTKLKGLR